MNRQFTALIMMVVGISVLSFCATAKQEGEPNASTSKLKREEVRQKVSITELKRLYETANSEYERWAVSLRAIDEGAIYRGGPVSSLDAILRNALCRRLASYDGV